ncbi:spermidine/putrescine ABC transporter substrate-binding protein [Schumannella luteola]|uniref:Spermidine/putrescine transport system substrate-binding protein n=1 Tax=Schumannella luteola TaxID=472059 RepID=A0A852Y8R5_9MICO|nr:spermidine/putrescine ABC transporter substrate-binding protein [Schumannella luteola]NYG97770.1 spermidine/putrescine transport system substrate-binding protein [Schumannella luteola]TPX02095.1 spermidine/putrescine ABC transporter substrate-binding protein [Schumannella luteola]
MPGPFGGSGRPDFGGFLRGGRAREAGAEVRALIPRAASAQITRRALLSGFAVSATALTLAACARETGLAASAPLDGELESQLNVYSWGDYDDPRNISAFQRKNGVTVQIDSYGSNEEMISKLGATRGTSGYDIIVPTGVYVPLLAKNKLVQKLDLSKLKNFDNLLPAYRDQSWDPGNVYTVCKDFGTTGYAYNTEVIDREMTSWQDFLDVAETTASHNTALLEDPWEVSCIWFAANGIDPNTTKESDLDACEKYMVNTLAPHVKAFNSSAAQSGIPQETFSLIQAFNGDVRQAFLATEKPPKNWKFVFPTPTANLWMDCWAITTGAQHPDSAYAFIDSMLEPEVAYRELDYIGYSTGLRGQEELARKRDYDFPDLVFLTEEVEKRLTPSLVTDATERLTSIMNRMMAKAGS